MNGKSLNFQFLLGLAIMLLLTTPLQLLPKQTSPILADSATDGHLLFDQYLASYVTHDPIAIESNDEFEIQGFPGNGSDSNPYVIEGYQITSNGDCIRIENTDAFFLIQDCFLTGAGPPYPGAGVRLDYLANGEIRNNVVTQRMTGIFIYSSSNITLVNNTITNSYGGVGLSYYSNSSRLENNTISGNQDFGVSLSRSNNNTIENNTISENRIGVHFSSSSNNIVMNNTMRANTYGVYLVSSPENNLWSNTLTDNGFLLSGLELAHWRQTITSDNLVNGKQVGYFWNKTGGDIDSEKYGQVILVNCSWVTVENGVFINSSAGIQLAFSSHCTLMNNTISGHAVRGVYLYESISNMLVDNRLMENDDAVHLTYSSDENTIVNNIISDNDKGLKLHYSSDHNVVDNNTITGSAYHGLELSSSSNNLVTNNSLINNRYGVECSISTEENIFYLNVIAYCEVLMVEDNGIANQWNTTGLGNYWSDYSGTGVYNISGSSNSIDYYPFVYPGETTIPTIDQPSNIDYDVETLGHSITWTPSDANPSRYMIYQSDTLLILDNWNGSSIHISVDGLGLGVYEYTIVVYDTSGNSVTDSVLVSVLQLSTSPSTTTTTSPSTTPTTTTTPEGTTSPDNTILLVFGGAGVAVIIMLIVVVQIKRK